MINYYDIYIKIKMNYEEKINELNHRARLAGKNIRHESTAVP